MSTQPAKCERCDRDKHTGPWTKQRIPSMCYADGEDDGADLADCISHEVDWRQRALDAEADTARLNGEIDRLTAEVARMQGERDEAREHRSSMRNQLDQHADACKRAGERIPIVERERDESRAELAALKAECERLKRESNDTGARLLRAQGARDSFRSQLSDGLRALHAEDDETVAEAGERVVAERDGMHARLKSAEQERDEAYWRLNDADGALKDAGIEVIDENFESAIQELHASFQDARARLKSAEMAIGRKARQLSALQSVIRGFPVYSEIAAACRQSPGPCFCGVHIADLMESPTKRDEAPAIPSSVYTPVLAFFDSDHDKANEWFRAFNPLLGATPMDLIALGKVDRLKAFIETQLAENAPAMQDEPASVRERAGKLIGYGAGHELSHEHYNIIVDRVAAALTRLIQERDTYAQAAADRREERDRAIAQRDLAGNDPVHKRVGECIKALAKAGMGMPGKSNALVNMVEEIIAKARGLELELAAERARGERLKYLWQRLNEHAVSHFDFVIAVGAALECK